MVIAGENIESSLDGAKAHARTMTRAAASDMPPGRA